MLHESFAADWSTSEQYRGANATMHGVEAFLAIGDVTGSRPWHDRASGRPALVCRSDALGPGEARVRDARRTYPCSTEHPVAVLDRAKSVLSDTHGYAPECVVVTPHLHCFA